MSAFIERLAASAPLCGLRDPFAEAEWMWLPIGIGVLVAAFALAYVPVAIIDRWYKRPLGPGDR